LIGTNLMAGGLIAFYQVGYGVAAFGIGPLHDLLGPPLFAIFAARSIVAAPRGSRRGPRHLRATRWRIARSPHFITQPSFATA
jgi:hypothetical protein